MRLPNWTRARFTAVAALLLIVAAPERTSAQKASAEQPLHSAFTAAPGQKFTIKVKRRRQEKRPGRPEVDATSSVTYDGEVIERKKDGGYVMQWTARDLELKVAKPEQAKNQSLPQDIMGNALKGQPLKFETDEQGRPVKLNNWRQLVERSTKALEKIAPSQSVRTMATVRRMMNAMNDSQAASLFLKDAHLLASLHAMRYAPDTPVLKTVMAPNPLGGPAIKTNYVGEITDNAKDSALVIAQWSQRFDPKSMKQSIERLIQMAASRMPANRRQAAIDQMKTIRIMRTDRVNGTIDKASGWTRTASAQTDIQSRQGATSATRTENVEIVVTLK